MEQNAVVKPVIQNVLKTENFQGKSANMLIQFADGRIMSLKANEQGVEKSWLDLAR